MENPRPRHPLESLGRAPGEDEAARPVGVQPSRGGALRKRLLVGLSAGALVLLAVGITSAVLPLCRMPISMPRPPSAEERKQRAVLATIFQGAKDHLRERRWTEAQAELLRLQAMAPDFPVKDYLERVEQEIPNQEHLAAARAALADKKLAPAKAELEKVRADTVMFEQVAQLKRELLPTADARVREASSLYDQDRREEALAIVSDVLAAFPEHRDAQALHERSKAPPPGAPEPSTAATRKATALYKEASAAKAKGQWARAVEYARRTLKVDPGHSGATSILIELRNKAKDLHFRMHAVPLAEPEEAIQIYQRILAMTTPDDELHQKAKKRIEQLSR